jgi:hypothetical protein
VIEILVMSQGKERLVQRALASLHQQNFPRDLYQFRTIESQNGINREEALHSSSADWVVFLDEDCVLPSENFLWHLQNQILEKPEIAAWGGLYDSEPHASYSQKAYNELCNSWLLLSSHGDRTSNLLGGILALHVPTVKPLLQRNPISWGGEDTYMLRRLQENGIAMAWSERLNVLHSPPSQTLARWKERALLHGMNRQRYALQTSKVSFKGLCRLLLNFRFWPLWSLHFAFLIWGSRSQPLAHSSRPPKSLHKEQRKKEFLSHL